MYKINAEEKKQRLDNTKYSFVTGQIYYAERKKLGRNSTRILQVLLNRSWKQHLTKQQVYGY